MCLGTARTHILVPLGVTGGVGSLFLILIKQEEDMHEMMVNFCYDDADNWVGDFYAGSSRLGHDC